jgi:hypothetical protein
MTSRTPRLPGERTAAAWSRVFASVRRGVFASDVVMFAVLAVLTLALGFVAPVVSHSLVALVVITVLAGGLFLRVRALIPLLVVVAGVVTYNSIRIDAMPGILASVAVTSVVAVLMAWFRGQLGVQGFRGEAMLMELRDKLAAQGRLPPLPNGWEAEVVLGSAGSSFGGDFLVSTLSKDGRFLEVALVDVSGKGVDAGTRALLLSGALGGLLGALPGGEFLPAANAYLLRQRWDEGFVTAVHLEVDLRTGNYVVESAGHPPAVHFEAGSGKWRVTQTEGPVIGVMEETAFQPEKGVLRKGDALMLYTDGLIETPGRDLDVGIDRLLGEAERLVTGGFRDGARKLVGAVASRHTDDRALVLIWRI